MNTVFRRGYNEYKRQIEFKRSFARQTRKIKSAISVGRRWTKTPLDRYGVHERPLLVLFPLVEVAWADGRVSRREMDAITGAAAGYGLTADPAGYQKLAEHLLSRPTPGTVAKLWQDFRHFLETLTAVERQEVVLALLEQSRFVAEQSSDSVVRFLRGERISPDERDALRVVSAQLEELKEAADAREEALATLPMVEKEFYIQRSSELLGNAADASSKPEKTTLDEDMNKLLPLVPLVKVAWAEGRITRRERELIFAAAQRKGIEPGSSAHQRLSDWFDLHPTDEFYTQSLERLREQIHSLPEDQRVLRRLDLLSDCVNVAEASGGESRYPAGGTRICDEEKAAVKRIASKLNGNEDGVALAA